jgi:hypothetical protein
MFREHKVHGIVDSPGKTRERVRISRERKVSLGESVSVNWVFTMTKCLARGIVEGCTTRKIIDNTKKTRERVCLSSERKSLARKKARDGDHRPPSLFFIVSVVLFVLEFSALSLDCPM